MAPTNRTELLVSWLKDAYAMEHALVNMLDNQAKRAAAFPQVQSRLRGHLEETRRHADMVKSCVERLGANVSKVRSGLSSLFGEVQSQTVGSKPAAQIKDAIMAGAIEQYEIATYRAIITLADEVNDLETASVCRRILEDEESMAEWVSDNFEAFVRETINLPDFR